MQRVMIFIWVKLKLTKTLTDCNSLVSYIRCVFVQSQRICGQLQWTTARRVLKNLNNLDHKYLNLKHTKQLKDTTRPEETAPSACEEKNRIDVSSDQTAR